MREVGSAITFRLGPLAPGQRGELEALLRATRAFRRHEVAVALEVFDAAMVAGQRDYTMLAAFGEACALLGYACWGETPCTEATWDLYWIAVHPDAQGYGVGTALLDTVERRVAGRGGRLLVIETSSQSAYDATRGFYHARGYELVARVPDFYDVGDDRLIYTKRLGTPKESV